jgi:hypothetical protein
MGTNYYMQIGEERYHIGKSSVGWCFSLHVDDRHPDLTAWALHWNSDMDSRIINEYGDALEPEEMEQIITERSFLRSPGVFDYAKNRAVPGPHGLVRYAIGEHCSAHGPGTWDLCPGEFR